MRARLPWRWLVSRLARRHGFLDPLTLHARLQNFAQPSEVAEPIELLRAGAVFHARGLLNARVIQHNLDWVWPYWIERQFDPADVSFLPRAFSLTHVNLTHRNWTAIGLPGREALPIVDPRGLLTPHWDGWSIDVWCLDRSGAELLPSRAPAVVQRQRLDAQGLGVTTHSLAEGIELELEARVVATDEGDVCRLVATGRIDAGGQLVVALRPCNPEGVSRIDAVALAPDRAGWLVDGVPAVRFDRPCTHHHGSRYASGDVHVHLLDRVELDAARCNVGMATAAAAFAVESGAEASVTVDVPLEPAGGTHHHATWPEALHGRARLRVPDARFVELYDAAVATLVLCTPDDAWAGPYTYKRYWYRDAVFVGHGLLCAGLVDRARHLVHRFPQRQGPTGYYHSQEGEWDANGEVLWLAERLERFGAKPLDESLWSSLVAGADWIVRKRLPDRGGQPHEGLLPAGFSAEHLGPNDHYYWDDYWGVAGLRAAARLARRRDRDERADAWDTAADAFAAAIERSLGHACRRLGREALPAAPTRRLDAGAIGSLVASYPLGLCAPDDARLAGTLEFLLERCFHEGGFFQDMIHSGVNAYLTLHVAQCLLRAGDSRHAALVRRIAELASPTGHWPEAVHPRTGGGCMGDGHHAWAAAEWIAAMRNGFLREEEHALVLGAGLLPEWLVDGERLSFGPAPSAYGPVTVELVVEGEGGRGAGIELSWRASWHDAAPALRLRVPGHRAVDIDGADATGRAWLARLDHDGSA